MKLTLQLGIISALNILFIFLFQWYVFTQLGPGIETDALFAGMTVPQLALAIISGSLMHVLVPLLAGESEERLRSDAWGFLVLIGGLFLLVSIVLIILAPWWVPVTVPGFDETGQALTVELTRIQLIGMVFTAISGVQLATYHAQQQFVWAELASFLASAVAFLLLIWALPRYGVLAAAWLSTVRMVLQTLLLTPGMGMPVRPNFRSAVIRQAWSRIKPLLLGSAYYKTDPLIDRFLLSMATSGSLSLYYLAQQIYGAANQVLNKAIAAPLVPLLSQQHKAEDKSGFEHSFHQRLLYVGVISLVSLIILALFGQTMLESFVGYGNVGSQDIANLWWTMIWLGGMFIGGAMGQITSSSFYAIGDTSTPTRIGIYTYTFYIPIKIALFYYFGVKGVALATSAFLIVNFLLQNYYIKKKYF